MRGTIEKFISEQSIPSTCERFQDNKKVSATIFFRDEDVVNVKQGEKIILTWEHVGDVFDAGIPQWLFQGFYESKELEENNGSLSESESLNQIKINHNK